MTAAKLSVRRCAVYTRKSSEEGLEQDFNSLDAQREACEAYIRSQAGEGWKPVRDRYDDGGHSGGTMNRPALEQLLADIRARKVDTVVVYKVDRLTRSLPDFAKIVEVFDAHGVSFVSVTQQFNTTTSMGRLTLNMLLSFAQFEREVTGERIRDKIAASKKKGMWMGGYVPLGYEPDGRTLSINEPEAETVRTVFRLYLAHGNVRLVKEAADRMGLTTKIRSGSDGRMRGGRPLSRGYIYKLLGNPLYVGRIAHKGQTYEGQHPAIIDAETWDAVQAGLAGNAQRQFSGPRASEPSLLTGKLFDEAGARLTPSHAVKSGRRYRYYVSAYLIDRSAKNSSDPQREGWRLPAREIERIVGDAVTNLIADPAQLASAAREAGMPAERIAGLLDAASRCQDQPIDLVERVELGADEIAIRVSLAPLTGNNGITILHTVPVHLRRRGVEMRLVLLGQGNGDRTAKPDAALIKAVLRAHKWFDDLAGDRAASLKAIARSEGYSDRYVGNLIPLAFLAPEIVEAILAGTQPVDLTAEMLTKRTDLPLDWAEQKALLGFV
jgi:DNA invertase Pin-like site-specific DNA recombinase